MKLPFVKTTVIFYVFPIGETRMDVCASNNGRVIALEVLTNDPVNNWDTLCQERFVAQFFVFYYDLYQ